MKLTLKLTLLFLCLSQLVQAQYLHRTGKYIYDGNNKEFIIRSMGLGGWMIQEGYMLETSAFAGTQHEIRAKIEGLIGVANTDSFYNAWLQNHCTQVDIDSMAAWGFNAIRLPMHYNLFTLPIEKEPVVGADTWLPKGFAMVDSLLDWCTKAHIYLILDLHAAPGGQGKDANISDYDSSKPSLWESAENRRKTVALWSKLAERYSNAPWIGGYDLLNETNWTLPGNTLLRTLFTDITTAIRKVDKNHLVFIEGNSFANDFTGLTPAWDTNMAYSFHKYWNATDVGTIQYVINMRDAQNVPLWMGESGENSNEWFYETIKTLETAHIGWSWWPLKKINSIVCPLTVKETANYKTLLNYWTNGGTKPTVTFATNALLEIADNLKFKNCIYHPDYIDALFRQQTTDATKPWKLQQIPGVIKAADFDMGRAGIAYADKVVLNDGSTTNTVGNSGWNYRNDGVDIDVCSDTDTRSNGYCIGWIDANEWALYTVNVSQTAAYTLTFRYASGGSGGTFHVENNGANITGPIKVSGTGGWQSWKSIVVPNVILNQGTQKLKIFFETAGYNLSFMEWKDPVPVSGVLTIITNAATKADGNSILVNINKLFDKSVSLSASDFTVKIGSNTIPVSSLSYSNDSRGTVVLIIDQMILYGNIVKVSYSGISLKSDDGVVLSPFTDIVVQNNTPFRTTLPGKIEAEQFQVNSGMSSETCTDTGGGLDMGYTNAGDYLDYLIYVPSDADFSFEYRIASLSGGSIELRLVDQPLSPVVIHTVTIPGTGGWQTWKSVLASGSLPKGPHILRVYIKQPEFNFNWLKISYITGINSIHESKQMDVFPNPVRDLINFKTEGLFGAFKVNITNQQGLVVKQFPVTLGAGTADQLNISNLPDGFYILSIENQEEKYRRSIIKLSR